MEVKKQYTVADRMYKIEALHQMLDGKVVDVSTKAGKFLELKIVSHGVLYNLDIVLPNNESLSRAERGNYPFGHTLISFSVGGNSVNLAFSQHHNGYEWISKLLVDEVPWDHLSFSWTSRDGNCEYPRTA